LTDCHPVEPGPVSFGKFSSSHQAGVCQFYCGAVTSQKTRAKSFSLLFFKQFLREKADVMIEMKWAARISIEK
jgi:hypothetical protein